MIKINAYLQNAKPEALTIAVYFKLSADSSAIMERSFRNNGWRLTTAWFRPCHQAMISLHPQNHP